jgi:hypothetical protein
VRPSPRYPPLRRALPPPSRSKRRTKRARAAVPAIPARPATRYALPPLAPETRESNWLTQVAAGGQVPGESLLKVPVRRQRTRRSPRGVRFEPEVSADTSRSRPDTSAGATDTRGGGRGTASPALSRRPVSPEFRHCTFTGIERPRPHFPPRPAGQTRFDSSAMGMGGESHDGPDASDGAETRVNITKGA